jgi:hypothetical protein
VSSFSLHPLERLSCLLSKKVTLKDPCSYNFRNAFGLFLSKTTFLKNCLVTVTQSVTIMNMDREEEIDGKRINDKNKIIKKNRI